MLVSGVQIIASFTLLADRYLRIRSFKVTNLAISWAIFTGVVSGEILEIRAGC